MHISSVLYIVSAFYAGKQLINKAGGIIAMLLAGLSPFIIAKATLWQNILLSAVNMGLYLILKMYDGDKRLRIILLLVLDICIFGSVFYAIFNFKSFIGVEEVLVYHAEDLLSLHINKMQFGALGWIYMACFIYFCVKAVKNPRLLLIVAYIIICTVLFSRISVSPDPSFLIFAGFIFVAAYSIYSLKNYKLIFMSALIAVLSLQVINLILHAEIEKTNKIKTKWGLDKINFLIQYKIVGDDKIILSLEDTAGMENSLKYACSSYKKRIIGDKVIYYNFQPVKISVKEVTPEKWSASANFNEKDVWMAFDRDITTRWTTHKWQVPGMEYILDLGSEVLVNKITVYNGEDTGDRALGMKISVSKDKKEWEEVVDLPDNSKAFLWSFDWQEFCIRPVTARYIKLEQTAFINDFHNYWSIREIYIN